METDAAKKKDTTSWSDEIDDFKNVTYSQLNAAESIVQGAQEISTTAAAQDSRVRNHGPERAGLMESVRFPSGDGSSVAHRDSLDDQTCKFSDKRVRAE